LRLQFTGLLARPLACLLAGAAFAAAAQNTNQSNALEDKTAYEQELEKLNWKEAEVPLPRYPSDGDLIEFQVSSGATFRFFIDATSLNVSDDGVVRYTLVARSPSGVANVSFEGIRCITRSYKVFARGAGGRWSPAQGDWRYIETKTIQRWHNVLYWEYLCPRHRPIETAAEGVNALRRGIHPGLAVPFYGVGR
jgi:hypothetical protein